MMQSELLFRKVQPRSKKNRGKVRISRGKVRISRGKVRISRGKVQVYAYNYLKIK